MIPARTKISRYRRAPVLRLVLFAAFALVLAVSTTATAARARETLTLSTQPVRINYDPADERVAKKIAEICEDEIPRLGAQLGVAELAPVVIELEGDITKYRSRLGNQLPRWGVAFALMGQGRMVVDVKRATRAWNSLEKVIPHEFSHLLVAQRVGSVRLPIWFLEGLAKWQAYEWSIVDSWQLMNAVWGNKVPPLWRLIDRYPEGEEQARAAYRVSHAAFTYLFEENTDELPAFLDAVVRYGDFDLAFTDYWGEEPVTFYRRFHEDLARRYHSRLLIFQPAPLFSIMAVLFLIVVLRYSLRRRRKLRELERLDAGYPRDPDR